MNRQPLEPVNELNRSRLWIVYVLIGLVFVIFVARLFTLQVVQGADYTTRAIDNRTREISLTTARVLQEQRSDMPGVSIEIESVREYPTGGTTAEVVGFLGPIPAIEQDYWESLGFVSNRDKVGYAGIENYMNDVLVGKNGSRVVEVDNSGQILRDLEPPVEPVSGNSLTLTIDTRLQAAAKAALVNWMDQKSFQLGKPYTSGVVIAMDPRTGEILAL